MEKPRTRDSMEWLRSNLEYCLKAVELPFGKYEDGDQEQFYKDSYWAFSNKLAGFFNSKRFSIHGLECDGWTNMTDSLEVVRGILSIYDKESNIIIKFYWMKNYAGEGRFYQIVAGDKCLRLTDLPVGWFNNMQYLEEIRNA